MNCGNGIINTFTSCPVDKKLYVPIYFKQSSNYWQLHGKVYKSDGSLVEAQGKVKVEKGMYSIFEMEKRPAHVVANGHETQPGSGGTKVVKWKIEQPEEKSLIWPVSEIKS